MKKLIFLLSVLFLLTAAAVSAEDAVLWFDSFDGGGYEYTVTAADPDIVSYTAKRDYGDQGDEPIDGASFRMIFTFTGLRPGETTAVVSARSPIIEGYDQLYFITVDKDLDVSVTPDRRIVRFYLRVSDMTWPETWILYRVAEDYFLVYGDETPAKVSPELADFVLSVIDRYDMISWNGFSGIDPYVLDGGDFILDFKLADRTTVRASGTNLYPDNYSAAENAILIQFRVAEEEPIPDFTGTYVYTGEGFGGDFTLTIDPDGTFRYSEGPLSSFSGSGTWSIEESRLFLDEERADGMMWYYFDIGWNALGFASEFSDEFTQVDVPDGGVFVKK